MSGKPTKTRKQFLIYPKFQLLLLGVNFGIMVAVCALVAIQAVRAFAEMHALGLSVQLPPNHPYFKFLEMQSHSLYSNVFLAFVAGVVVSAGVSLYLSHRLAGPIVRLTRYLKSYQETKTGKPLRFRKDDFFSELPGLVNGALGLSDSGAEDDDAKRKKAA